MADSQYRTRVHAWTVADTFKLSPSETLVVLAVEHLTEGRTAQVPLGAIVAKTRLSLRTVRQVLGDLVGRGVLLIERLAGAAHWLGLCPPARPATIAAPPGSDCRGEGTGDNSLTGTGTGTAAAPLLAQIRTKPASVWKRMVAIAHQVMDDFPSEHHSWSSEIKARAGEQGLPYGEVQGGRPLYARVEDYVERVRQLRTGGGRRVYA